MIKLSPRDRALSKWRVLQKFAVKCDISFYSELTESDMSHLSFTEVMDLVSDLFALISLFVSLDDDTVNVVLPSKEDNFQCSSYGGSS